MKEKLLKEKGAAKAWIIVIVLLVVICVGLGVFAVVKMNKDSEDEDEKTSKKNENTSSQVSNEDNNDSDEDKEEEGEVTYTGELDMSEIMGSDEFEDTKWTVSLVGDKDSLSEMVIRAELENYFKEAYESDENVKTAYTYEEFIEEVKKVAESSFDKIGEGLAEGFGVSSSDITVDVDWVEDETLEISVDLSKVEKDNYNFDDDENVIEAAVKSLEEEAKIEMKKSK